jgi:hypothetical protein
VFFLVAVSCLLTVYFHSVLNRGSVFSHFFYIPIILSALWWGRKGLTVAVFLAIFLVLGHVWMRDYVVTANDYFRALMFIVVPYIISGLGNKITVVSKRAHDLDFIIRLVYEITRFVVVENNRKKLAESIAKTLATSPKCRWLKLRCSAWMAFRMSRSGYGEAPLPLPGTASMTLLWIVTGSILPQEKH